MAKKRTIVVACLVVSGLAAAIIGQTILLRSLGILPPAELSKEEVRHLLRGVQLPEALNPEAVRALYGISDGTISLRMRIHVKGKQADELLGVWLPEASRESSDPDSPERAWKFYDIIMESSLLPLRDDDILAIKNLGTGSDVRFVLRKRDGGVDIHCFLWRGFESDVSEEARSILYKGQYLGPPGQGYGGERHLGDFRPD